MKTLFCVVSDSLQWLKKKKRIEKAAREREKFILKDLHGHFILHLDKWLLIVPVYRIYLKTCVNGCCRRRIFTVNGCCRVSWRRWGVCVAKQVRGQDKLWLMTILSVDITKVLCFVFVAFENQYYLDQIADGGFDIFHCWSVFLIAALSTVCITVFFIVLIALQAKCLANK